ncbi:MAG: glycosyltransferase family 2 protein [Paludibacter sp.]|nr:glycosyltransferase family 2 protein [Paludibacter sp.]
MFIKHRKFKLFIYKHLHISFTSRNFLKGLVYLAFFYPFYQTKLFLYKKIKGIKKPIIHYYCVCWNEETVLPFVFNDHADFVSHFYICDNGSTDNTLKIIEHQPNASVINYTSNNQFNVRTNTNLKNKVWKRSRGKADYVIVVDADEFLYHSDLQNFLKQTKHSIFKSKGYDMVTEIIPEKSLVENVKKGEFLWSESKVIMFSPNKIMNVNYVEGCHYCYPYGIVSYSKWEIKLLHYKYLTFDYLMSRVKSFRERYNPELRKHGYGAHYYDPDERHRKRFQYLVENGTKII